MALELVQVLLDLVDLLVSVQPVLSLLLLQLFDPSLALKLALLPIPLKLE